MSDRRTFLTRSGLALGALLLGDEALDTHRLDAEPLSPYRVT